jgi:hypothetical protein
MPVAKGMRDRRLQRALLQFFKPENYFEVREALLKAGRGDLIGSGCDALISANPPKEALLARRERSEKDFHEHTHMKDKGPAPKGPKSPKTGYRPQRSQWGRREGKR